MKDNTVLIIGLICNLLKDIIVVGTFGFLAYHFNNIWYTLLGLCFIGGYSIRTHETTHKKENDENEKK